VHALIERDGKAPLPPYIKKDVDDAGKYQTVYAQKQGAIAAPTAGMHFTPELLDALKNKGVRIVHVTLHCGLATFRPVKVDDVRNHPMETEWIEVSQQAADVINLAKDEGKKVFDATKGYYELGGKRTRKNKKASKKRKTANRRRKSKKH
jgi:S-adenosylmethionine:tRNA ribosyltransferase-isomerase